MPRLGGLLAPLCQACLARSQADLAERFTAHVAACWTKTADEQAEADEALVLGEDSQAIDYGRAASRALWMALRFDGAAATDLPGMGTA